VILVKTPFRISLVGGSTDIPAFYEKNGHGAVVSFAIDKYMYVMIHPYFHEKLRVKYSRTEDVDSVDELKHPIVRECLRKMDVTSGVEIASIADIPAGLGLGSSSSFTVCLLHALYAYRGAYASKAQLAAEACEVEIDRLQEPIGKQDQYAAAYGGLNHIQFNADGSVELDNLTLNPAVLSELMRRLTMFYLGRPRSASEILSEHRATIGEGARFEAGQRLVALAAQTRSAVKRAALDEVGDLLHEGWQLKKALGSKVTSDEIDRVYEAGRRAGARGGKLLGAGGGGFMLFYSDAERQPEIRRAIGLRELKVGCDRLGSRVIYNE
jgi:D-glycero-alpha-D-manno-heptose-7-phosphate kinase